MTAVAVAEVGAAVKPAKGVVVDIVGDGVCIHDVEGVVELGRRPRRER